MQVDQRTGMTDERTPDSLQRRYYRRLVSSMRPAEREGGKEARLTFGCCPWMRGKRRTYKKSETVTAAEANDKRAKNLRRWSRRCQTYYKHY